MTDTNLSSEARLREALAGFADKLEAAIKARDFRDEWTPCSVQQSCSEMVHEVLADFLGAGVAPQMSDEDILIWYESLEAATCNTETPEQGIISKVRELLASHPTSDSPLREQLAGLREALERLAESAKNVQRMYVEPFEGGRGKEAGWGQRTPGQYFHELNDAIEASKTALAAQPAVPTGRQADRPTEIFDSSQVTSSDTANRAKNGEGAMAEQPPQQRPPRGRDNHGDRISKAVELLTKLRDHAEKRPMRTYDAGLCVMANRVADDIDEALELLRCE